MKNFLMIFSVLFISSAHAQKVESIWFNLYTDSLKKGVYNYINVDGKLTDSSYQPLTGNEIIFTSSAGKWEGNSLVIDSAYQQDSVVVTASLKENPGIKKTVTIYIKKTDTNPPLKTQRELLEEWRKKRQRKN